jgi:hypothetical protein
MILKQRIVVGAKSLWLTTPTGRFIEHTAASSAIYVSRMNSKANNPARVLIHHHHDPVGRQGD